MTNSTTADFGVVQPLFSRILFPHSVLKGKLSQFVRLAPMPWPTFGDLRMRNIAVSVPIEQVFPAFASFMAHKDYTTSSGTYFPTKLPYIPLASLYDEFVYSYCTLVNYVGYLDAAPASVDDAPQPWDGKDLSILRPMPLDQYFDFYKLKREELGTMPTASFDYVYGDGDNAVNIAYTLPNIRILEDVYNNVYDIEVARNLLGWPNTNVRVNTPQQMYDAMNSADFIYISGSLGSNASMRVYKLTRIGAAVRKILLGLGYDLCKSNNNEVCVLPLLAYAKAYFDTFYPKRSNDWMTTSAYKVISTIEQYNVSDMINGAVGAQISTTSTKAPILPLSRPLYSDIQFNRKTPC